MNANATSYYFIRVDKDEEGEIVADFKSGSPRLFAKMIMNNQNDSDFNAWARKSVLPNKQNYDRNLAYDPTTQKLNMENNKLVNVLKVVLLFWYYYWR